MDLFKLLGTISINNTDANKALEETSQTGQQTESKLGKAFSAVGKGAVAVGKTIATGMAVGATAVGTLATKSIQAYADYEQLVGGVDTLFKESSAKVQEYAANAYKTAGLSANEYMETVTSFSASLLQSLEGDTNKATEHAQLAITDMADNANKMGTDISMIQNAYQGFAKQNYTMLDNLKLGYGGTADEMQRLLLDAEKLMGLKAFTLDQTNLADVVNAIHAIQTEMGITGTTAAEASSTISGSIASMKSSWQNLLTAISADDLPFDTYVNNFVDSVTTVTNNLLPRIEIALGGVIKLIEKLAPVIIEKIPSLFSSLLPAIVNGATGIINSLVATLPGILDSVISALPALLDAVQSIINSLIAALPTILQTLVDALPTLIPILVNAVVSIIVTLCEFLPQIIQPLIMALPGILMSIYNALLENLPTILESLIGLFMALIDMLPVILPVLIQFLVQVVTLITQQLPIIIPMLIESIIGLVNYIIEALPGILMALIEALPALLQAVWDAIVMVFTGLPEWCKMLFQGAFDLIKKVFTPVVDFFSGIWEKIKPVFEPVIHFFEVIFGNAWTAIKAIWSGVSTFFSGIWQVIKVVFDPVIDFFKGIFNKAWEAIKGVFSGVKSFFSGIWDKIKSSFSEVGTKIGDSISGAVKSGINGLIGQAEGIINGFLGMINNAVDMINKVPGVKIDKVEMVSFARLAKGGVVDEPTPAIFGEDGAEAVVPLENNTGWLNKVARQLHDFSIQYEGKLDNGMSIRSVELQQMQVSELQALNATNRKILEAIIALDENMGGNLREALDGVSLDVNKREFARLVRGTI